MRLYLVQHGDAVPEQADPRRPLSATGRQEVEAVARLLAGAGARATRIAHSGKLRAQQTAELLAAACGVPSSDAVVEVMPGLGLSDPVAPVAHRAGSWAVDTMLVGHLPFMARLAGHLVAGNEVLTMVAAFVPGTVLCLEPVAEGRWAIVWMVRPELALRAA